jgi:hypothetical protein
MAVTHTNASRCAEGARRTMANARGSETKYASTTCAMTSEMTTKAACFTTFLAARPSVGGPASRR